MVITLAGNRLSPLDFPHQVICLVISSETFMTNRNQRKTRKSEEVTQDRTRRRKRSDNNGLVAYNQYFYEIKTGYAIFP